MKTNKRLVGMVCAAAILLILSVSGIIWLIFGTSEEEKETNAITAENISVSSNSAENDTDTDSSEAAATQSISEPDSYDSRAAEESGSLKDGMQVSDPDDSGDSGSVSASDNISFSELTDTENGKNGADSSASPVQEPAKPGNDPADDEASGQDQELRFGVLE